MAVDPVTAQLILELSKLLVTSLIRIGQGDEAEVIKNSTQRALPNYQNVKDWSES